MRSPAARELIGRTLMTAADLIKVEARLSITRGSVSGKNHVPSAPGEPPNRDTGILDSNIESYRTGQMAAEVRSQAPYAGHLEFGTSKMAARPYMRPASLKMRPQAMRLVDRAVKAICEGRM